MFLNSQLRFSPKGFDPEMTFSSFTTLKSSHNIKLHEKHRMKTPWLWKHQAKGKKERKCGVKDWIDRMFYADLLKRVQWLSSSSTGGWWTDDGPDWSPDMTHAHPHTQSGPGVVFFFFFNKFTFKHPKVLLTQTWQFLMFYPPLHLFAVARLLSSACFTPCCFMTSAPLCIKH